MRIQEISGRDALSQQVIAAMISRSSVLTVAEFYSIIGNADYNRKVSDASGGKFRGLDTDFADNKITPKWATPALKILGDKVQVDRAHERRGQDVASVRSRDLLSFARDLGKTFQNYFFNGDTGVSAEQFDGLKVQMPAAQKLTAATDGFQLTAGNSDSAVKSQQEYMELLDKLIEQVDGGAQAIFMDGVTIARTTNVARGHIEWTKNEFGVPVAFYNQVPILPSGFDKAGNRVLPHNEVVGASGPSCTSVYAVRFGEAADLSLSTNIGVEVKDLGLVGVHYTHSVELDLDLVVLNDKAMARLEGVIVA